MQTDEFTISQSISKIMRLLKCADNITLEGGKNYLEEFVNLPNVTQMLKVIKNSQSCREMFDNAEENRRKGILPIHEKTDAEKDKIYAQTYLNSGNLSQPSVEEELEDRANEMRKTTEIVVEYKYLHVLLKNDIYIKEQFNIFSDIRLIVIVLDIFIQMKDKNYN